MITKLVRFIYPRPMWIFIMFLISGISIVTLYSFHISVRILWLLALGILLWCFLTGLLMFYWLSKCIATKERKHLVDLIDKKSAILSFTTVLNYVYFLYYLYVWIRYRSFWFGTMTVYYIALSFGRSVLVAETRYGASRIRSQWKKYILCGYMVLAMTMIMFIQTILITQQGYQVVYPGNTIWLVLVLTVYLTFYAIKGWVSFKKWKCPLLQADRSLAFCSCLLGLYSLMIGFSDRIASIVHNLYILDMSVGIILIITLALISIYMIIHGSKELEKADDNTWLQNI